MDTEPAPATGAVPPDPSPVTVREVLAWADLDLRLVGDPVGLDRHVRWAQAQDLLDPSPYLRGGELVLTTGAALVSGDDCRSFVGAVDASCAAAIGFGVGVFVDEVPPALVAAANRRGLSVLAVPTSTPFVAFTEALARHRASVADVAHDRRALGRLMALVRDGSAGPVVLHDRLPAVGPGEDYGVICLGDLEPTGAGAAPGGVVGLVDGHLVVLAGAGPVDRWRAQASSPVHGFGGVGGAETIPRLIGTAMRACALSRSSGRPAGPTDLASFAGLVAGMLPWERAPFRERVLAPLAEHDARRSTDLVETVRVYLAVDGSAHRCAAALHCHVNTLRNRLARVRDLTGLDPYTTTDRATLTIALFDGARG